MYDIVRRFTDRVEEYSIDECFADITDLERPGVSYADIAKSIKLALQTELGMTFSLGLGPTKVIAKVASKWNKPDGFTIIKPSDIPEFLREMQIGKIWGIGPSTASKMQMFGIRTAFDFIGKSKDWVEDNLSRPYLETWHELRGTSVYEVDGESHDDQKSVQATRTFSPITADRNFLLSELSRNVEHATTKVRSQKLFAKRIYYFLKTQEFRYQRFEIPLTQALQSPMLIFGEIKKTFDACYQIDSEYRATGVTLGGLVPESQAQNDLFGEVVKKQKWNEIFNTVDKIDRRYGSQTMTLASSLSANQRRDYNPHRHLKIPSMGETL